MRQQYGEYLTQFKDETYRDHVFAYVEKEDTPRPLVFQLDLCTFVASAPSRCSTRTFASRRLARRPDAGSRRRRWKRARAFAGIAHKALSLVVVALNAVESSLSFDSTA